MRWSITLRKVIVLLFLMSASFGSGTTRTSYSNWPASGSVTSKPTDNSRCSPASAWIVCTTTFLRSNCTVSFSCSHPMSRTLALMCACCLA